MYVFKDINKRYPLHIRNHNLLAGGFLLAIGVMGAASNFKPMIVFITLLCALAGGLIARTLLVQVDYTGGIQSKHVLTIVIAMIASAFLLAWTYRTAGQIVEPQFKRLALPFILVNFLLMHLPFLIVHGMKRIKNQPLH